MSLLTTACGQTASPFITSVINICSIVTVSENAVVTLGSRVLALKLIGEDMTDSLGMNLGALTPGVVVTPRRYRLPPDWSRVGRAWLAWTASLCRGLLVSTCMNFIITPSME